MVAEKNSDLVKELEAYRSVNEASRKASTILASSEGRSLTTPGPDPPRTILTRVGRRPLASLNNGYEDMPPSLGSGQAAIKICAPRDALMTLAELDR